MIHKCPICKTPTDSTLHEQFPFCSNRCREKDLGNWATERYVVSEPLFGEDDIEKLEKQLAEPDLEERHDSER